MDWMNAFCLLAGVGVGVEIAYLCMKSKNEIAAEAMRSMESRIVDVIKMNTRIFDKWGETIKLNGELLDELMKRD